jgi:hypothetical protein
VKGLAALWLALLAVRAAAATAYVSDELVLGVYAEQNNQGPRLTTLHSGARLDTLVVQGEFTQVRLSDGTTGWVKSAYLTTQEPAVLRVKKLEEELDRSRATTPALAEAAARSEVEQLTRELAAMQAELDAARESRGTPAGVPNTAAPPTIAAPSGIPARIAASTKVSAGIWIPAVLAALAGGFWVGYATLAHRIRHKFGGIKVY